MARARKWLADETTAGSFGNPDDGALFADGFPVLSDKVPIADGSTEMPVGGAVVHDASGSADGEIPTAQIETASTASGTANALTEIPAELIAQLFIGYFNRAPDHVGLIFWLDNYNRPPSQSPGGVNPAYQNIFQILLYFADPKQAETVALYPFLAHPEAASYADVVKFVVDAYFNLFGRTVDGSDQGVRYWAVSIAKGLGIPAPVFGDPAVDNAQPFQASVSLIYLIRGALGSDAQTIANKVAVGRLSRVRADEPRNNDDGRFCAGGFGGRHPRSRHRVQGQSPDSRVRG